MLVGEIVSKQETLMIDVKFEVTKEMLVEAVGHAALDEGLTTLVRETIASSMAKYLHDRPYGTSEFERAVSKFLASLALEILEELRPQIRQELTRQIDKALPAVQEAATEALVLRIKELAGKRTW